MTIYRDPQDGGRRSFASAAETLPPAYYYSSAERTLPHLDEVTNRCFCTRCRILRALYTVAHRILDLLS